MSSVVTKRTAEAKKRLLPHPTNEQTPAATTAAATAATDDVIDYCVLT